MAQNQGGTPFVFVRMGTDEVKVEGRAARLIIWLLENRGRVNGPDKGILQVDFSRRGLHYRLTDCFDG